MNLNLSTFRRFALRMLSAFSVPALLLALPALAQSAQAPTPRVTFATRSTQSFSTGQNAGILPVSQRLTVTLTLAPTPARAAALDGFLLALTTPSSPSYHQWLTPAQFASAFGATPDQLTAATTWAALQGLSVDAISSSGLRLTVSGTSSQLAASFATEIHAYTLAGQTAYYANVDQPSLPAATAPLFVAIQGLDNLPTPSITLVTGKGTAIDAASLATLVDANATPLLALASSACAADLPASQLAAYTAVFRQAAAQGITTLSTRACATGAFPAALAEVTAVALPAVALPNDPADALTPTEARPGWQSATGLPADALRHAPDLTVPTLAAFVQTLTTIAGSSRLGNINPILYELGPTPGLYTQPDAAPAGTWEPATGLGLVDLDQLGKVYPRGTGSSFTSFSANPYSPTHGQTITFTSSVTSGTGGATPTGTVSFTTSTGTVLGTATLVNGTGTISINTLEGGNYTIGAVYSGDATYAPSSSATGQFFVQPEPSMLTAAISGNPTIGGSYNVTVTDTGASGVGVPTGPISVQLSGTASVYTAVLSPSGANSASATVTIPVTVAGTLTLSIQCTTSADFSCFNPLTTTVTIAKATPTLSISYSPNPPVAGGQIALNAVVSTVGTAPAPTGAVTFYDNGVTLNAGQLANGSTSTTGTVPQATTNTITATYAGDPNYNSVSTTAGSTTSGTIKTTLVLTSSTGTVTPNTSITFTATLAVANTGPAAASGTVTFFDGGTQIGTANLTGGATATFTTNTLSATVNHTITAVYSGDGNYSTSTSNALGLSFSNASGTATVTLAISPTNPVHGQKTTFVATVASAAGGTIPTGTVTFSNSVTGVIGTATLSNGVASFTSMQLTGGSYSYTAIYSGDTTYATATSAPYPLTVTAEPDTLTIQVPTTASFGAPFVVAVTVTGISGTGNPTGTVTVQPTGTGYAAASSAGVVSTLGNGTGTASVTVQGSGAGAISFTATYTGDANFAPAGPTSLTAAVAKTASSTTLALNPTQPVTGQPTSLIAKVAFVGSTAPTGTVEFFDGSISLGTANLDATGTAMLSTTFSAGNHLVKAVYSGDSNYMPGTSVPVNTTTGTTASTTTLAVSSSTVTVGGTVTLSVAVGPTANGATPTGTVQIFAGGNAICTITLAANGQGTCTYTDPTAGALTLTANYLGDGTFAASTSAPVILNAGFGTGALTATLSSSVVAGGGTATVTATVTAPAGTIPTGAIAIAITNAAGTVVATSSTQIPATATNTASAAIPITAPTIAGSYTVTVSCANTNFSCTPVALPLSSTGTTTGTRIATTTTIAATATTNASVVTLTATVTPASTGAAVPSGTVTFYDGTVQIGTAALGAATPGANGTASTTVTLAAATAHSITAVYSGDTLYAGSSSTAITGVTTTTSSVAAITLTASTTTALAGSPVVLTATVSGTAGTTTVPSGTVSFFASGTTPVLLGTATLGTAGSGLAVATLTTNSIPTGTASVYAVYNGDTNFKPATSNSVAFGLGDYTVAFTPPSLTLAAGQSGQATLTVAVANGFAGTIALGCTPPANQQITCSVSPLTPTGGGGTATLTITTVAPHAQTTQQASFGLLGIVSCAALLCWLLPLGKRRRLPAMFLVLLALALASNLGCSESNFSGQTNLTGGTPLGTSIVMVNTLGTIGSSSVRHDYAFQVTVQ